MPSERTSSWRRSSARWSAPAAGPRRRWSSSRWRRAIRARGGHEWLVEFRIPPQEPEEFARIIDETLIALNADYRTKRTGDVGMIAPIVTALPAGTFHRWMRAGGKLGDQHKVPRATNDRAIADALLATTPDATAPRLTEAVV